MANRVNVVKVALLNVAKVTLFNVAKVKLFNVAKVKLSYVGLVTSCRGVLKGGVLYLPPVEACWREGSCTYLQWRRA